jgi:hypothetical protein
MLGVLKKQTFVYSSLKVSEKMFPLTCTPVMEELNRDIEDIPGIIYWLPPINKVGITHIVFVIKSSVGPELNRRFEECCVKLVMYLINWYFEGAYCLHLQGKIFWNWIFIHAFCDTYVAITERVARSTYSSLWFRHDEWQTLHSAKSFSTFIWTTRSLATI